MAEAPPDLVVLDWMLPTLSGLKVRRQLRRRPETHALPVPVLTARGEASDAVRALDAGADDHVAKPFEMEALLARICALLRRAGAAGGAWEVGAEGGGAGAGPVAARGSSALAFADLVLDRETHRVTRGGRALRLGPTEYRLLEFLLRYPRRVFTREQLLSAVWGPGIHVGLRTVDVHVRRLRRALDAAGEPDLIRTVRAAGYALDDTPEPG